jgi:serine phosphatase RsbU (regulator of sigma subunit)
MDKFSTVEFQLQKGDQLYMFSDGFADQFGGKKGKKFKSRAFKEIILANADKGMNTQKEILETTLNNWQQDYEQVDDITVFGLLI